MQDERAHVIAVRTRGLTVSMLGIEDLIIDRLNACVHWSHEESCDVARALLLGNTDIDWEYLCRRAAEDERTDALEVALGGADSA
jgi:predicted nucleotidyltransferase